MNIFFLYVNIVTNIEIFLLEINIAKLSPLFSVVCFGVKGNKRPVDFIKTLNLQGPYFI
jgi:hypothetical protein